MVPAPYNPVNIAWTVCGNAFAAATDRHISAINRSFSAGDAGFALDSMGTDSGSPRNARYSFETIAPSSRSTVGRFVSHTHRRLSSSSPLLATSWSASHAATR